MRLSFDATATRARLWQLLGDVPPLFTPQVTRTRYATHDTYSIDHLTFDNGAGAMVTGYLLLPHHLTAPTAAVLYHHIHGNKYDLGKAMMIDPQRNRNGSADGIELVKAGFIVLGIDAYAFGERQHQGAAGKRESGAATELTLFKQFLWAGKTLWGMMVRDDLLALAYLRSLPAVDPTRIGTTGMSLGGSRATWVAALDGQLALVVPIAQMTRYADFAETGAYHQHSIYYYVPGMLASGIDMEHIVCLAHPARQMILIGDRDPLSPLTGVHKIVHFTTRYYRYQGDARGCQVKIYPDCAHTYSPAMHHDMRQAFIDHL